jgi:hypothetical protein
MVRDLSKHKELLSSIAHFRGLQINKDIEFLETIKPLSNKLNKLRDDYGLQQDQKFNFFTLISDQYKKENLHSDILAALLDPKTEIYNKQYLDVFLKLLKNINNNISEINFSDNVSVERETGTRELGRIDIFIYDDKYGVIIENKINHAPDQDDQLARYVDFAIRKQHKEILAVVYIPPIDEVDKPLPLQYYSKKYKKYIDEIEKKLVRLPVLEPSSKNDIVHDFLDKIVNITADETARVFIKQYSNLLKGMGENIMANEFEKGLLRELLKTKESVAITADIVETYEKRMQLIGEIVAESLVEKNGFMKENDNDYYKLIGNDIYMCFAVYAKYCCLGLYSDEIKPNKDIFKEILNSGEFSTGFSDMIEEWENNWVYKSIEFINEKISIKSIIDFITERFVMLEKKVKAVK